MADGPVLAGNARDGLMRDAKKGVDLVFFFSRYGCFFCLVLLLTGGGNFVFVQEVGFFARFAIGRIYLETFCYYWEVIPLVQGVVRETGGTIESRFVAFDRRMLRDYAAVYSY
jgi:hypothetical protein